MEMQPLKVNIVSNKIDVGLAAFRTTSSSLSTAYPCARGWRRFSSQQIVVCGTMGSLE